MSSFICTRTAEEFMERLRTGEMVDWIVPPTILAQQDWWDVTPTRPGVSMISLLTAEVRNISAADASKIWGLGSSKTPAESGAIIPYRDLKSRRRMVVASKYDRVAKPLPFGRQRLATPKEKKYDQRSGTGMQVYVPPLFPSGKSKYLILVEGEFKALSLMENGFTALGLSGIWGWGAARKEKTYKKSIHPDILSAIEQCQPECIYFLGDNDVALNYDFYYSATEFVSTLRKTTGIPVKLPRWALTQPKGIDDVRDTMDFSDFQIWWEERMQQAIEAPTSIPAIGTALLESCRSYLKSCGDISKRSDALKFLSRSIFRARSKYAAFSEWVFQYCVDVGFDPVAINVTADHEEEKFLCKLDGIDSSVKEIESISDSSTVSVESPLVPVLTTLGVPVIPAKPPAAVSKLKPPFPIYYDHFKNTYLRKDARKNWINIRNADLTRHLRIDYKVSKSLIGKRVNDIQTHNAVSYAGPLAGVKEGPREFYGKLALVTESPNLLTPSPGPWPMIGIILDGLLNDPAGDQRPYFHGWLKIAVESLYNGFNRPGQALALAGPRDCGKSLLQSIITLILGNRVARPYQFMTGQTPFNGDLFAAEHLIIEDDDPSTEMKARRALGANIKMITVNPTQRCHVKGKDALVMEPFWRLTITVNDEPRNLMMLPPLDESIEDKLMIFKAGVVKMPMPTADQDDRAKFWEALKAEVPHYLHYIFNTHKIDPSVKSERMGITHYHHPDLLAVLSGLSAEKVLLRLIDTYVFTSGVTTWDGTAEDLEKHLSSFPGARTHLKSVLDWTGAIGTYLGHLAKSKSHRVKHAHGRIDGRRGWLLLPP